ncbi:uncharacterized protein LOC115788171 [Archocentrus centrarchus]|uniref:uncharacterized protein LOC115788171 n=1 Tax=Archocentrus centrarchus TaxID=63155 RepID=UPI0011EA32F6|nr:uncharacterized protein LOC115788171 [Archocentrus centrarchus]
MSEVYKREREHLPPKACAQGGCKLASDNRRGAEEEPGGPSGRADAETRTHRDQRQRGRAAAAAGPNLLPVGGIVLRVPDRRRRRRRMKKSNQSRRGVQDSGPPVVHQPEKMGWIRKFCGRGIFRELWRSRYVMLRGDYLYISDKEVRTADTKTRPEKKPNTHTEFRLPMGCWFQSVGQGGGGLWVGSLRAQTRLWEVFNGPDVGRVSRHTWSV